MNAAQRITSDNKINPIRTSQSVTSFSCEAVVATSVSLAFFSAAAFFLSCVRNLPGSLTSRATPRLRRPLRMAWRSLLGDTEWRFVGRRIVGRRRKGTARTLVRSYAARRWSGNVKIETCRCGLVLRPGACTAAFPIGGCVRVNRTS
jgi:hypothetical protein